MSQRKISMRPIKETDIPILEYWDQLPHVIESGFDDDQWNWKAEILRDDTTWRWMFMAELEGRAIGCVQIIDPHLEITHYWGDCDKHLRALDIWIGEKEVLNKGYGTQMMEMAIKFCFADPLIKAILIDPLASNTRAIRFYERLGFEFVENRTFDDDNCKVYKLNREVWQE